MTIVVDVNTLPCVFNSSNELYKEFIPVSQWIDDGDGKLVFGGSKYKEELAKMPRYLRLVRQLNDRGKAVRIDDAPVDAAQAEVEKVVDTAKCDDPHIIGLLGASRCQLLCSKDRRSFKYVKDRALYPRGCERVRVYTGLRNAGLLCKDNIVQLSNVA